VDLFVREFGPADAPTIVFLHGGRSSGWSWEAVVERLPEYRALVPDLPQYGKSIHQGPFEIRRAAEAVAELIRSRTGTARVHLVGFSLGAQVGVQLLATEPDLIDRAVLCGTVVNTLPGVRVTQSLLGLLARTSWFRWVVNRLLSFREAPVDPARIADYREDLRLITGAQLANVVVASAGFTVPEGLDKSEASTLYVTGAKERAVVRRWAAALARPMPNGIDRVAIGMRHDWPLRNPDLFSRTVDGWLSGSALPAEIAPPNPGREPDDRGVQLGSRTGRPAAR
jgi:pimeloyl-ACP methyl ester carboxylesterase